MFVVPIHQAKSTLSQLIKRVERGEVIAIGGYGHAQALLTPAVKVKPKKRLGLLAGHLVVPDDFDAPLPPDILATFEGYAP